ncbi:MAG: bifunctional riboflavin kinase/FAD synthetase [Pelagibacteraceae bacterium]
MKILRNKFSYNYSKNSILVIGNFDGLHLGHISILKEAINLANKKKLKVGLLTFDPNPKEFFIKNNNFKIISLIQKEKILSKIKLNYLIVLKFNKKLRNLTAENFIKNILKLKINPSKIIVGKEFRFGKNRSGNTQLLKNYFDVKIAKQKKIGRKKISSSEIRKFIQKGKITKANNLLGRYWSIYGKIISGDKIGRKLGFRTANTIIKNCVQPLRGVYVTKLKINNKTYDGVSNFGIAPTFGNKQSNVLETHLFTPIKNLYKKNVKIQFLEFLRKEKKFKTKKNLTDQIKKDITIAKKVLKNARK